MTFTYATYQFVGHVVENVHGGDAEGTVLPLTVHNDARLLLKPREIVIPPSVKQRVAGRSRRRLGGDVGVQLVAVVTDADFELDGCVDRVDHGGREEGSIEFVLASTKERLHREGNTDGNNCIYTNTKVFGFWVDLPSFN